MFSFITIILISVLLLSRVNARPWEVQKAEPKYTGTFVPHLIQALDSWVASMLSQSPVPLVGAGAALAYIGYAGTVLLTSESPSPFTNTAKSSRSVNASSTDFISQIAGNLVTEALGKSDSAVAFRRAGARALQHGATVLRRALNAFSKAVGALYSTLSSGQKVFAPSCVSERLCRIGQMTGMYYPILGILLRSLDSGGLDEYSKALVDGTTVGDCRAIYPNCLQ